MLRQVVMSFVSSCIQKWKLYSNTLGYVTNNTFTNSLLFYVWFLYIINTFIQDGTVCKSSFEYYVSVINLYSQMQIAQKRSTILSALFFKRYNKRIPDDHRLDSVDANVAYVGICGIFIKQNTFFLIFKSQIFLLELRRQTGIL